MKLRVLVHTLSRQARKIGTMKLALAPVALLLLASSAPEMAQEEPQLEATAQVEGPLEADAPHEVVLADLPQATPTRFAAYRTVLRPQNGLTDEEWKALKAQAAHIPALSRPEDGAHPFVPSPNPEQSEILTPSAFANFLGQNENLSCSGVLPSDMGLAVNSSWVLQAVNNCVSVYTKTGVLQTGFPKTLDAFFAWPAGTFMADPRATYDFVDGRWIVTATAVDSSGVGWINVAASATSDPRGTYHVYKFNEGTGNVADYPTLGQNWASDAFVGGIYVCFNLFNSSHTFVTGKCLFLPKMQIYAGSTFSFNSVSNFAVSGTLVDTIQPVNVYEPGAKPRAEFAINSFNFNFGGGQCRSGCNGLVVWSFANTLVQTGTPGPKISSVVVKTPSSYSLPANADQPGANNSIDTGDVRISGMVHYSAGLLFPTLNTGNGGTSAVLGWVVKPFLNDNGGGCTGSFTNACPTITSASILQEFCYDCGAGHTAGAYYGAIVPLPENNWTMAFNHSTGSINPGTAYTSNRVTWAKPFHDGGTFACQQNVSYSQGRWGDYTAAAPDIGTSLPATWVSGMFVLSGGAWGTCITANRFNKVTDP